MTTNIKDYSTTQASNTSLNGIDVDEGMLPSNLNNALRALMKNTREWFNDSQWVEYGDGSGAYTAAYASATSFTIAGVDVTPIYHEGRRIKLTASTPGTIYGTISSSTFSTNTTINVTWDSGSLSNEAITNVYIGALSKTNNSFPTGVIATATLADGSVTTIKIADSAVTTAKINDAAVTNAKLGADSVNGSKIADDSINSEHYVDGSIDTAHIADSQITTAKIADTAVTTAKITDSNITTAKLASNSVTTVKITDSNVTTAKIAADAIDGTKIADDSINSEHYVDGSIDTAHIANSQITTAKIADSNVTTAKIADSNVTTAKINNDAVTINKIADAVIVTNSEASGHTPDDVTFLTTSASDSLYFRQDSSETINSGQSWSSSDAFIATTAAIDARVTDLVDDVGGFVPIANETSFPNANPDVNNGAGTIVSISSIGSTRTPSGGTVSISGGTVGGSTVTITGCGSTVLTAGFGVLVETSTTLNTYTFHRLVPKATEVTTVAAISSDITTVAGDTTDIGVVSGLSSDIQSLANIEDGTTATNAISNVGNNISSVVTTASNISGVNSFADRYRISSSAPTTSLDSGDLYFNTSTNVLNVYGASGWQNAGSSVNGTSQRYNYTATNGQTTFTGSDNGGNTLAYDAGFIDVYLNGVKLLNGTDVTVTSGSSVVLASGATIGDVVDIVAYGTFSVASLNADNLDSGTVPDARITGAYTGITGLTVTGTGVVTTFKSTNNNTVLRLKGSNATNGGALGSTSSGDLTFLQNLSEGMRLTSTGLGIGTTSPSSTLHVETSDSGVTPSVNADDLFVESSGSTGITIGSGTANFGRINFGDSGDANIGIIQYEHTTDAFAFTTNASEAMRIDSSGRLLVGKTVTTRTVAGAELRPDGFIRGTKDSAHAFDCVRTTDDGDVIRLYKDNTHTGSIGVAGSNPFLANPNSRGISLGSNLVPCNSSGTAVDNLSDIGTSSARWNDLYLGGGAYIGGTGTANKLDDYEEGTWTPSASVGSVSHIAGGYIKIGRLVTLTIDLLNFSESSSTANIQINGIPFAVDSSENMATGAMFGERIDTNNNGNSVQAVLTTSSSGIFFFNGVGSTNFAQLRYADINDGADCAIRGTITYLAAS